MIHLDHRIPPAHLASADRNLGGYMLRVSAVTAAALGLCLALLA